MIESGVRPSTEQLFYKHLQYGIIEHLRRGLSRDGKLNTQTDQMTVVEGIQS